MQKETILVIGSAGQIGSELVSTLRKRYSEYTVISSDVKEPTRELERGGTYIQLDVMDELKLHQIVEEFQVTQVYLLAAILSATAERNIELGWRLNMRSLSHILDLARFGKVHRVFWPSSIAVFGSSTPKQETPQTTITEPSTVYGISKLAGERWCEYYAQKFNCDVRSIRYPGLISHKGMPGGGTTDYAVHVFYDAIRYGEYTCFVSEDTALPMMFMEDAVRATVELMDAPKETLTIQSSYNLSGFSITPKQLEVEIKKYIPHFKMNYKLDYRNEIAQAWPSSIDSSIAQADWGWDAKFSLEETVKVMLEKIQHKITKR